MFCAIAVTHPVSRGKTLAVFGDRATQARPATLSREFAARARTARKRRGKRVNPDGFRDPIDAGYCGVLLRAVVSFVVGFSLIGSSSSAAERHGF